MRTTHHKEMETMKKEMERDKEEAVTEIREEIIRMYKRKISAITQMYEAQVTVSLILWLKLYVDTHTCIYTLF